MKKKLKILHISPTYFAEGSVVGGGEKYISYLDKAIKIEADWLGIHVESCFLACTSGKDAIEYKNQVLIPGITWEPRSVDLKHYFDYIKTADLIVVHQCLTAWGLLFSAQARRLGKPIFGYDHGGGEHPLVSHTAEIGDLFDTAISYSEFGLKAFADLRCQKRLIRGPVDTSLFNVKPNTRLSSGMLEILSVGRIMPHKGFERIISAMPQNSRLTIIGSSYDADYLQYLKRCSHLRNVRFLEGLKDRDVANAYLTADIYVHASTHVDYRGKVWNKPELLGLAPLEALSCGTPALVSTAGSLPELSIVDGCTTFSCHTDLVSLLENASDSIEMYSPALIRSSVERCFGCKVYGHKFMQLALERLQ